MVVNLGMLGYFKYGGFLLENWQALMSTIGVTWTAPGWNIVLPVGISFYTFQTMAYSLDVYLRRAKPAESLLDFALFVTFFPQLVAGPIVRPTQLIPQFQKPVRASRDQLLWGLGLVTLGLFQKIVIADGALAPAADAVFGAAGGGPILRRVARARWRSRARSSPTSRATRPRRSGSRCVSGSRSRTTSASRTRRSVSRTSGAAGTSRSRPGCGTTCTSRSAATARAGTAPRST